MDPPGRKAATAPATTRTPSSCRPTSSSAGRARPASCVARRELLHNRVPIDAGRRHGRLRQPDRARLPRRHRASRGGRHAGDRRVHPRRPRVPAQGDGRRRGDPGARGAFIRRAIERWAANPSIEILGIRTGRAALDRVVRRPPRAAATSTTTSSCSLLNDLFGIQSRGGCSCAGPYGHRLLGIDLETSHEFEREIARGCEGIKPGWVRVNFNYFISDAVFEFILDAVDLVARDGWRLLPQYAFEPGDRAVAPPRRPRRATARSHDISYDDGGMALPVAPPPRAGVAPGGLSRRGPRAAGPAAAPARRTDVRAGCRGPGLRGPALVPAPRGRVERGGHGTGAGLGLVTLPA